MVLSVTEPQDISSAHTKLSKHMGLLLPRHVTAAGGSAPTSALRNQRSNAQHISVFLAVFVFDAGSWAAKVLKSWLSSDMTCQLHTSFTSKYWSFEGSLCRSWYACPLFGRYQAAILPKIGQFSLLRVAGVAHVLV
jgi:hypothetical protein